MPLNTYTDSWPETHPRDFGTGIFIVQCCFDVSFGTTPELSWRLIGRQFEVWRLNGKAGIVG